MARWAENSVAGALAGTTAGSVQSGSVPTSTASAISATSAKAPTRDTRGRSVPGTDEALGAIASVTFSVTFIDAPSRFLESLRASAC